MNITTHEPNQEEVHKSLTWSQTTQGPNQLWVLSHGKLISPLQITSVLCQASEESRLILFWSKENIPSVLKLPRGQIFANLIFILSATVLGTSVWEVPSYIVSSSSPLKPFLCLKSPWNYLVPWPCSWSSSEEIAVFNLLWGQRIIPDYLWAQCYLMDHDSVYKMA